MSTGPGGPAEFASVPAAAGAAVVAVAWAAIAAVHPPWFSDVADDGATGLWLTVHAAQLVLAPLVALAVLHLLRGLSTVPAIAARVAVVCWLAWFSAFDAIAGLASGVLVDLGAADAALDLFGQRLVGGAGSVLGVLGQGTWVLVALLAGLALRSASAPRLTYLAMIASGLVVFHAGPAVVGFLALAVCFWTARPEAAVPASPSGAGRPPDPTSATGGGERRRWR